MIIKTYLDKANGLQVSVIMLKNGRYSVVIYDIDAMEYCLGSMQFLDRRQAIEYAKRTAQFDEQEATATW